jgi:GNAT superfamily N-acetyltransferase
MRYVRRFRMEFDLLRTRIAEPVLPAGYAWQPWHRLLVDRHAAVQFVSFREELDAMVFRCFEHIDGCRMLMREIARQAAFLPGTTWLVRFEAHRSPVPIDCGTVQGLADGLRRGSLQNVGVIPEHRGLGLGRALVQQSLLGFRRAGLRRATLEVTADNEPAVELYRALGFRKTRTLYKAVEPDWEPAY